MTNGEYRNWGNRGVIIPLVALVLVVLLGAVALTVDIGRLAIAAQITQDVADAAALAGGVALPDYLDAEPEALLLVNGNNESAQQAFQVTCSADDGDIAFWGPNEEVPAFGPLGAAAWAIRVTVHLPVSYTFARVLGLEGATVARSCTVVRMPVGGMPITPIWINYQTDYQYGQVQQLLMADGPHYENAPGSFGWLEPPSGDSNLFLELLRGYNLTPEQITGNYVSTGDIATAYPGLAVGQWRKALDTAPDGLARMDRALEEPWTDDTFDDFQSSNPRLFIVPMCEYLGGSGSGAEFAIRAFGAFYIESIGSYQPPYHITGRFIQYYVPGVGGDPLAPESGLWTTTMVK